MKKFLLFFVASFNLIFSFETIDEALRNGVSRGDMILYGNYLNTSNNGYIQVGDNGYGLANYGYLGNLGYLVGSVGLSYTSGFYKNLRMGISFRAAYTLFNANPKLAAPFGGTGDAKIDFFNANQATLAESFLEYFDGDTSVKAGRISIKNDWINTLSDGIWVRNRSFKKIMLEGFWVQNFGRIDYYQMTPFVSPTLFGAFNAGLKYYILEDYLSAKVYTYFAAPIFTAIGGRIDGQYNFLDFELKANVGYVYSIENKQSANFVSPALTTIGTGKDGNVVYLQASFGRPNVFDIVAGYIHTGKESGWGSLGFMGNSIDPFFVWGGRVLKTQPNADLVYGAIKAKVDRFNFLIAYGSTSYAVILSPVSRQNARQNEVNVAMEIGFTKNVIGVLNVLNTHLDSAGIPTATQINGGIRLAF